MADISVVVPSFRQGAFLERTLASIRAQEGVAVELLVIDACSDDETDEVLARWTDSIDVLVVEPDGGQADAIAKGMRLASSPVVTWLNADDAYAGPEALATLVGGLGRRPDVDLVYGRRAWIDGGGALLKLDRWHPFDPHALNMACYLPQECAAFRRSAYQAAGGIDPSFRFALDYDLWLRMLASGSRFLSLPNIVGLFRVHADQKTAARWADVGLVEIAELHRRHLGRVVPEAEMMAVADAHRAGTGVSAPRASQALRFDLASILDSELGAVLGAAPLDRWALGQLS